jgi:hypothetical protein
MNKIFVTKSFVIDETLLLGFSMIGFFMSRFGFLRDVLGNCTSPCPPGVMCARVIAFCSEAYGRLMFSIFGLFLIFYLLVFVIYKLSRWGKF